MHAAGRQQQAVAGGAAAAGLSSGSKAAGSRVEWRQQGSRQQLSGSRQGARCAIDIDGVLRSTNQ